MDVADFTEGLIDADIMDTGAEGGDLECSHSFPLCSVPVPCSTESILWVRLTIASVTGMITTRTLVIDPATLGEPADTIILQISGMASTVQPTGLGDDEE